MSEKKGIMTMVKKAGKKGIRKPKLPISKKELTEYSLSLIHNTRRQDARLFFVAFMMSLHEECGFGKSRLSRVYKKTLKKLDEYEASSKTWKKDADELGDILGTKIVDPLMGREEE